MEQKSDPPLNVASKLGPEVIAIRYVGYTYIYMEGRWYMNICQGKNNVFWHMYQYTALKIIFLTTIDVWKLKTLQIIYCKDLGLQTKDILHLLVDILSPFIFKTIVFGKY